MTSVAWLLAVVVALGVTHTLAFMVGSSLGWTRALRYVTRGSRAGEGKP